MTNVIYGISRGKLANQKPAFLHVFTYSVIASKNFHKQKS
jgi:hypothetical protein